MEVTTIHTYLGVKDIVIEWAIYVAARELSTNVALAKEVHQVALQLQCEGISEENSCSVFKIAVQFVANNKH